MPDNQGAPASPPDSSTDDVKNLKSEFNRKLDNVKDELKRSNEALLVQLQAMVKPPAPAAQAQPEEEDLSDLMYKNPKRYTEIIEDRAAKKFDAKLAEREREQARLNSAMSSLYNEFPELNATDGELYKLAISKHTEMSKEYGNSVATMKAAVAEAALELGVRPKSKRSADEDFTLPSSGGGSSRPRAPKEGELHPHTKMWAEILGVNEDKVKARQQKRRNFTKYE